ncbi:hypothetical protein BLNAU_16695 [Blattamonas nauphoetae]|uniref:Uncharacterized protein n=1 Tax=Blattamonas nauphoetae TaxID=2049346 RepID=A0ABQ9X9H9_9EUKA|nr:hypothetical protein BLNAU_16695 [Blattamonas nauphoetae]
MQSPPMTRIIAPPTPTIRRAKTRRMRQVQLPDCPEDVIENLHRYPLLVWYDLTASNDSDASLLKDDHPKTLESLIASKCEIGEEAEWQDLMEWFVCAVIGLNSRASWISDSFWFDWDDVLVDGFGTTRINLFTSHSDSSHPHSPQSFSDCITHLSLLFLSLIDQLSTSNCLSKRTAHHSPKNVVLSVLHHLIDHLVNTGHLIPASDPSAFKAHISNVLALYITHFPDDQSLVGDWKWMVVIAYTLVHTSEDIGITNPTVRLTDTEADLRSPQFTRFVQLLDNELVEMKKQFDPKMIEEARRISSWKEFLEKVAGGEEVENDTSFLKKSFFRPTLLSLQAKFQQLASSLDGSDGSSTSSLHSSHSSPHTSLAAHHDSSLRTISSSPHFKQESLQLLNTLHSLLTSPLPPSLPKNSPLDIFATAFPIFEHDDISPTERFRTDIFDEIDNEKLARSLRRCRTVCDLVGAESCILDIPEFFDRTVSVLGSSNIQLRAAASSLFTDMVDTTSSFIPVLPHIWDRLRSAFHDGRHEEQLAFIRISTCWIVHNLGTHSLPPFPANQFDWNGLITADLSDSFTFMYSILLIAFIRHRSIEVQIGRARATYFILSFERHQRGKSRIVSFFEGNEQVNDYLRFSQSLISYCLLISLLSNCAFPPILTTFITQDPEMDAIALFLHENNLFLLCHTSLNPHTPLQPPLDLIFERTLRMHPFLFFTCTREFGDISLSLLNTALCGDSRCVDILKVVLIPLLIATAPFGDCHSVRELFRSVDQRNIDEENPPELFVKSHCHALEWLNIPSGFESALAHSNTRKSFDRIEDQDKQHITSDASLQLTHHPLTMLDGFSEQATQTIDLIFRYGDLVRELNQDFALWILKHDILHPFFKEMLSPVPAEMSVRLEFLKRVVSVGTVDNAVEMVRFGMLDIVIRAVSESLFLEDYENGICVIGILLRSICDNIWKRGSITTTFLNEPSLVCTTSLR